MELEEEHKPQSWNLVDRKHEAPLEGIAIRSPAEVVLQEQLSFFHCL